MNAMELGGPKPLWSAFGGLALGLLNLGQDIAEADDLAGLGIFDFEVDLVAFDEGIEYTGLGWVGAAGVADRLSDHIKKSSLRLLYGGKNRKSRYKHSRWRPGMLVPAELLGGSARMELVAAGCRSESLSWGFCLLCLFVGFMYH